MEETWRCALPWQNTEAPGNRGVVQFGMDGLLGVATSVASF